MQAGRREAGSGGRRNGSRPADGACRCGTFAKNSHNPAVSPLLTPCRETKSSSMEVANLESLGQAVLVVADAGDKMEDYQRDPQADPNVLANLRTELTANLAALLSLFGESPGHAHVMHSAALSTPLAC